MIYAKEILMVVVSYLAGCICTGYYLVRLRTGKDIRKLHSTSTGARNVRRVLGWGGFAATLAGDLLKGAFALMLARLLKVEDWALLLSLLAVVIGHIWPVQLQFRGGKGIAVMFGALFVYDFRLVAAALLVFILLFAITRRYIFAGMLAVCILPLAAAILQHKMPHALALALLAMIILFAHRKNIRLNFRRNDPEPNAISPPNN